jgi:hypothetical protein
MKDAAHPAGRDFEKASDAAEAQRQQMLAALDNEQRAAFDKLREDHKAKQQEMRDAQARSQSQQIAERMRRHLLQDKELRLEHDSHRHKLKQPQELSRAIEDHLAGRMNIITREYNRQLAIAHDKAKRDVARGHLQAQIAQKGSQQRHEDMLLRQATRERATPEFTQAAKDTSWKRAFEKAARQETERGNDHELDRDRDDPNER